MYEHGLYHGLVGFSLFSLCMAFATCLGLHWKGVSEKVPRIRAISTY
jgi:hypothetical protein